MAPGRQTGSGPVHGQLPWWAMGLAALGFAVLLALVAAPAQPAAPVLGPLPALAERLSALLAQSASYLG